MSQIPSHNPIPMATGDQCIKCSKSISENQSFLQCQLCMLNIHSSCLSGKNRNVQSASKDIVFSCDKCSQCSICSKKVANNHKAILCDLCNSWAHIKCNKLSTNDYEKFKNDPNLEFTCMQCNHTIFPFMSLNNDQFYTFVKKGVLLNDESTLELNLSPDQKMFMDRITNQIKSHKFDISDDEIDEFEDTVNCKYYSADDFRKEKFSNSSSFSVLHLNIHSIERHIDELQVVLDQLKFKFDVMCFSESKIMEGVVPKTSINLDGYQDPIGMPTNATKGGVLIYVRDGISFVQRDDLNIQKEKELESCFVEIQNTNQQNSIVGVVYRHPTMEQSEFIDDYLTQLTQRLSKEKSLCISQVTGTLIY